MRIGADVDLEVTQIGKECHHGCAIRQITGDCIMPREGVFCRVLAGGEGVRTWRCCGQSGRMIMD